MAEIFEVGGCVRDKIMGKTPKDIDFSVVADSFDDVLEIVQAEGMKIVQIKREFGTVIAVARKPFRGHTGGLDFVWARIDGPSSDGRRPDWTRPGTLMDDLSRRDFTMNAIAETESGIRIDPFGGCDDISSGLIRCVGKAEERLWEDALRGLRALRFMLTKGFDLDPAIVNVLESDWFPPLLASVSKERQREEMEKMFSTDSFQSMMLMADFPAVAKIVFSDGLRLSPTMKRV